MKILYVSVSLYLPSNGGANKANRSLLEQLAARGHRCVAVTGVSHGTHSGDRNLALIRDLEARRIRFAHHKENITFHHSRVTAEICFSTEQLLSSLEKQICDFAPDWLLVSSEDPMQVLLETALRLRPGRVIYIAHTTLALPCGRNSFMPNAGRAELLRQARAILAPSGFIQSYISQWAATNAFVFRFPVYGAPPYPFYDNVECGLITIVNPCAVKGIVIFEELVKTLPHLNFAAVPTWGTTSEEIERLASYPNLTVMPACDDIDRVLSRTGILLVPSLWEEAFGQVAVEAMLRGIPVVTSDVGGLPEAALGVAQTIPVRPIEQYTEAFDERFVPVPMIPEQDVEPWKNAVAKLAANNELRRTIAVRSRQAALEFVKQARVENFESLLSDLENKTAPSSSPNSARPSFSSKVSS